MRERAKTTLWTVTSFALVFAIWELAVLIFGFPEYLLPGPGPVVVTLAENVWTIALQTYWTAGTVLFGFLAAALFAIPLAMLLVISRVLERLLYPPMVATQSIPKIALAPLLFVLMRI